MSDLEQTINSSFNIEIFDNNHCFLCGELLTKNSRTEEHVYPRWLQRKYNLWNQKLRLLNKTLISYKELKIPCCKHCNAHLGEAIEKPIENAVSIGYDALINLDKQIVFQWLCKLSYGVLYKEMNLRMNRANPSSGTILAAEDLKEETTLLLFLRAILTGAAFDGCKPYSLIIFRIYDFENVPFWLFDSPMIHAFFVRMGDIGIIANLMDNGVSEQVFMKDSQMSFLTNQPLHPVQFNEICAKYNYKLHLMPVKTCYMFDLDDKGKPVQVLGIATTIGDEGEWNQKDYAKCLTHFLKEWQIEFEMLYQDGGLVRTFLWSADGSFVEKRCIE